MDWKTTFSKLKISMENYMEIPWNMENYFLEIIWLSAPEEIINSVLCFYLRKVTQHLLLC